MRTGSRAFPPERCGRAIATRQMQERDRDAAGSRVDEMQACACSRPSPTALLLLEDSGCVGGGCRGSVVAEPAAAPRRAASRCDMSALASAPPDLSDTRGEILARGPFLGCG